MEENKKENELLDAMKAQTSSQIEESTKGFVGEEALKGLKDSIENAATKEEVEAFKVVLEKVAEDVKANAEKSKEGRSPNAIKGFVKENEEKLKNIRKEGGGNVRMTLKAFDTDSISGAQAFNEFLPSQNIDGIARTPNTKDFFNILNYVSTGRAFSEIVKWFEEDTETGAALFIDECVAKPDVSKTWKRNEAKVRKVADYTRVCDEVLIYIGWAEQEIKNFLAKLVREAIQEAIINGDGTGENLLGIVPQASAFVAGSKAASVIQANFSDAIAAAASQINCLGHNATYAFVNCDDLFVLNRTKTSDGIYINPLTGVTVVDCPYIPAGSFLVGDMSKSNVLFLQDVQVDMGMNGEDFRENAVSLRGEAFLTHYIASNHGSAFVFDTFANVVGLIDKP